MYLPSVLLSIFRNKNQLYLLIGLISLATISIILISVLTIYVSESELRAWEKPLNYFSIAEPVIRPINDELSNSLQDDVIGHNIEFMDAIIKVPGILNSEYRPVIALNKIDILKFMNQTQTNLIEGELPKPDTRDIIISESIAKSKDLETGDYVGNAINENEFLWGRFHVSGIFESELDLGLASLKFFERRLGEGSSFIIFPEDNITNMNEYLSRVNSNNFRFETINSLLENNKNKNKNLLNLIYIIIIILIISLTIIVALYISLYLKTRLKEFSMYYSRGISRKNIIKFVLKEVFLVTILGQMLGIITSYLIVLFLKEIVFNELIFLARISLYDISLTFPLFISIVLASFIISYQHLQVKKLEHIIMRD